MGKFDHAPMTGVDVDDLEDDETLEDIEDELDPAQIGVSADELDVDP
jgi:hypothetical protein